MGAKCCHFMTSSVFKKQYMGITGLFWCVFLIGHLVGNCLIYLGPEAINTYGYNLTHNKAFFYSMEAVLVFFLLSHVGMAIRLTIENKSARPVRYYMKTATGRGATFASSTMPYTGIIILIFLISHLIHFRFGPVYMITHNGVEMRDLYRLLIEYFSNQLNVLWYIFAVICLGIHVSHGFWSAFQSIGFSHPKYTPILKNLAKLYAVVVVIGFSALPIYCYLQGVK